MKKYLFLTFSLFLASCQNLRVNVNVEKQFLNYTNTTNATKVVCLGYKSESTISAKKIYMYSAPLKYISYIFPEVTVDSTIANNRVFARVYASNYIEFLRKLALANNICFDEENKILKPKCTLKIKNAYFTSFIKGKKDISSYVILDNLDEESYLFYKNLLEKDKIYKIDYDILVLEVSKEFLDDLSISTSSINPFYVKLNNFYALFNKNHSNIKILNKIHISLLANKEVKFTLGTEVPYVKEMQVTNETSNIQLDKATDGISLTLKGDVYNNLIYTELSLNIDTIKDIKEFESKDTKFEEVSKYTRSESVSFISKPGESTLVGAFYKGKGEKSFSIFAFSQNNEKNYLVLLITPRLTIYKYCTYKVKRHKAPIKEENLENLLLKKSLTF